MFAAAQCDVLFTPRKNNKHGSCKKIILQKVVEMASSSDKSADKEQVPSKKVLRSYKTVVNKEWFNDENYKGIFNHSKIDPLYSVHCIICATDVYIAHQGIRDLKDIVKGQSIKKTFICTDATYHW